MGLALFRRSGNRRTIEGLHDALVDTARQEILFRDYRVADTVDGRFEMLVLHAALLLRRLNACAPPGPDMAQDLIDLAFRHLDSTLREVGVGDTSVPKRMKKLAEAFFGRAGAYESAINARDVAVLAGVLERNVYADAGAADIARCLAVHVLSTVKHLEAMSVEAFLAGANPFPKPANID